MRWVCIVFPQLALDGVQRVHPEPDQPLALLAGTHRFSDLRRKIGGVSEKMLAQTLEALAGDGFVLRQAYMVIPPKVEYSLTPLGREAAPRVGLRRSPARASSLATGY